MIGLSLDGAGICGIIQARILAEIELTTKRPISSIFQVIGGSSSSAILAMCYAFLDRSFNDIKYSGYDTLKLYH